MDSDNSIVHLHSASRDDHVQRESVSDWRKEVLCNGITGTLHFFDYNCNC